MEISDKYKRLVKWLTAATKTLGWEFEAKMEDDEMLILIIDKCRYYVTRSGDHGEKTLFGAYVPYAGNRDEPPSEDDVDLHETEHNPEGLITKILDTHWDQRKTWALESTYDPEDEREEAE